MAIIGAWRLKNNSNASIYNNGTDTSMSYNGSNAVFSGSGYIEINDGTGIIQGQSQMSAEVYCKITGSGHQFLFAGWEWGAFIIKNDPNNFITTLLRTSGGITENVTSQVGNDGRWHYIALDYNGSTKKTFYDGILINSVAKTGTISNLNSSPFYLQFGVNRQTGPTYTNKLTGGITEGILQNSGNSDTYYKNRYSYLKGFF